MRTMAYGVVEGCVVMVCGTQPFDKEDWKNWVRYCEEKLAPAEARRILVVTEGAGPSSNQRAESVQMINRYGGNLKCAVVTASAVSRGIVTALSWFSPGYRAFAPQALDEALRYLDIGHPLQLASARMLIAELKTQLDG